jgi:protein tyrosine phosphatase (PTP) superfamily phosphohydrolase (DUF442 family)
MSKLDICANPFSIFIFEFKNMKTQSIFANIVLYGRSIWQVMRSQLSPKNGIEDILNYRYISDKLATSGQPTAAELDLIGLAGYKTILNLAPPNASNALAEEQAIANNLGIDYINIPVVWDSPTMVDFTQFCAVMEAHKDQPIFVHCAMNMRVSAFMYLYRHLKLGVPASEARATMTTIWEPNAIWQQFIETAIASN